jgi:DNA-binding NarL/FixJ family response regulator
MVSKGSPVRVRASALRIGHVSASYSLPLDAVRIRVVLADDSLAVRDVLVQILSRSRDIDLVEVADDEPTLLAAVEHTRPAVVVTDVRMPPTGTDEGVRVAERLATSHADIGVVILSQYSDPKWLSRVFDSGSENRGWVMKERAHSGGQLINAIKTVHQGNRWIDPAVMAAE